MIKLSGSLTEWTEDAWMGRKAECNKYKWDTIFLKHVLNSWQRNKTKTVSATSVLSRKSTSDWPQHCNIFSPTVLPNNYVWARLNWSLTHTPSTRRCSWTIPKFPLLDFTKTMFFGSCGRRYATVKAWFLQTCEFVLCCRLLLVSDKPTSLFTSA